MYSSVPTDPDEINQIKNEMNHDLSEAVFESVQISVEEIVALCKIIDTIIFDKYLDHLTTSDLQFAFKKQHSTKICVHRF